MFRSPGIAMFRFSQSHGLFPQRPWRKTACQGCCSESTHSGDAAETFHGGGFFRNRPHPKKNSQIHIQKRSKLLERKLGRLAVSCSWWQESNSRPLLYGLRWGWKNYPAIFAGSLATNAWNWLVMKKHLWFRIIRIEEQSFKYPLVN